MSEWKELDRHNLPSDILDWKIGETHEVEWWSDMDKEWKSSNPYEPIEDVVHYLNGGERSRYRRIEPKAPSHEEIMTKWWRFDSGRWRKVDAVDPCDPKYGIASAWVDASWFVGRRSADIPPENEETTAS